MATWGTLLLVLGACSVPLLVGLGQADTTRSMEKIALASSQETWARASGRSDVLTGMSKPAIEATLPHDAWPWLVPTWNGRARVNKPPLLVWINLLAWSGLDPATAAPEALIHRARLVGVGFALLCVGSTFWAGRAIGDRHLGLLASLIVGSTFLFIRQGRVASYDTHMLGWVTLAAAAGLWAVLGAARCRTRVATWCLFGLATAAGVLTKGPIAVAFTGIPVLSAIVLRSERRTMHLAQLVVALGLVTLLVAPWFYFVARAITGSEGVWQNEWAARRRPEDGQAPWYYAGLFGLVFPWTVWLVAGLFHPFLRADGRRRRQRLVAWGWCVGIFVFMSIPTAKQQRYIVPILPAAALMMAQVWCDHAALARRKILDEGVNAVRWPHWIALGLVSLLLPCFWAHQVPVTQWLTRLYTALGGSHPLADPALGHHTLPTLFAWWFALCGIAVAGAVAHWRWQPLRAAILTVAWMLVLAPVSYHSYARSPHGRYSHRTDARQVRAIVGAAPLHYLYSREIDPDPSGRGAGLFEPDEEFLFYARRIIRPVGPETLASLAAGDDGPVFVMARLDPEGKAETWMANRGFAAALDFDDGRRIPGYGDAGCRLYQAR